MRTQKEQQIIETLTPIVKNIIQEHFKENNIAPTLLKTEQKPSFYFKITKLVSSIFSDNELKNETNIASTKSLYKTIDWLQNKQDLTKNIQSTDNANKSLNYEESFLAAKKIVMQFEGLSLKAYKCPAQIWTIGYGNTSYLKSFADPSAQKITKQKAEELLEADLKYFFDFACKKLDKICSEHQIAALTSFVFNIGIGSFLRSTLLKTILNNPLDYEAIKKQFLKWVYVKKVKSNGLLRRRECEFNLYCSKTNFLN